MYLPIYGAISCKLKLLLFHQYKYSLSKVKYIAKHWIIFPRVVKLSVESLTTDKFSNYRCHELIPYYSANDHHAIYFLKNENMFDDDFVLMFL